MTRNIEMPVSKIPHYRSDFENWVQCCGGIDVTERLSFTNDQKMDLVKDVGNLIIAALKQFDSQGLKENQKIAIPVEFDCNETREKMRRIPTKTWVNIQGLSEALPRDFDFLELVRDRSDNVLWFVFQKIKPWDKG